MTMPTLSAERRDTVLQCAQSLIQIETLTGAEQGAVARAAEWLTRLGYDEVTLDDCGNVIGTMYAGDGATVVFDSHLDTVPADSANWTYPPFGGVVADGKLYGRGSSDMKGAFAASAAGVAFAKQDHALRGTIHVTGTVGEEDIEGLGITRMIPRLNPDLVIICESTGLKLNTAQRGRAEVLIHVKGKSAHASKPTLGINALRNAAKLVEALDHIVAPRDPLLGDGILEPTQIISVPYPNVSVVPWGCQIKYDRRLLVGETPDDVLTPIRAVIADLHSVDPQFEATAEIEQGQFLCYTGVQLTQDRFAPAWQLTDESWIRRAESALRHIGQTVQRGNYSFCTNGSLTSGRLGIPTLGYGPGYEETAHSNDEYVTLDQLFGATLGYYALGAV